MTTNVAYLEVEVAPRGQTTVRKLNPRVLGCFMNFSRAVLVLVAHSIFVGACSNDTSNSDPATTGSRDATEDDASAPSTDASEPNAGEPEAAGSETAESITAESNESITAESNESITAESNTAEPNGETAECELPESAPPSCEACLADTCTTQYAACVCNEDCMAQFARVRECFSMYNTFDEPSENPGDDWATCEAEAGELSELYHDLMGCVAAEYVPPFEDAAEDPWNRTEGDGQCTAPCFDLFAFDFEL